VEDDVIVIDEDGVRDALQSSGLGGISLSYLCETPHSPGRFDVQKAVELGVEGSNRGLLVSGSILIYITKIFQRKNNYFTQWKSDQTRRCYGRSRTCTCFYCNFMQISYKLFVESDHLEEELAGLSKSPTLASFLKGSGGSNLQFVYHMTPYDVFSSSSYASFLSNFPKHAKVLFLAPLTRDQHIVQNEYFMGSPIYIKTAFWRAVQLNDICQSVFTLPYCDHPSFFGAQVDEFSTKFYDNLLSSFGKRKGETQLGRIHNFLAERRTFLIHFSDSCSGVERFEYCSKSSL
jgi:hypothetical protein